MMNGLTLISEGIWFLIFIRIIFIIIRRQPHFIQVQLIYSSVFAHIKIDLHFYLTGQRNVGKGVFKMCFISSLASVKLMADVFDEPFEAGI